MSETSYVPTFGKKKSKGKTKQDTSMLIRQINQRIEEVNNDRKEFENKVNEQISLINISILTLLDNEPKKYTIGEDLDMKMKEIKNLGRPMGDDSAVSNKYV